MCDKGCLTINYKCGHTEKHVTNHWTFFFVRPDLKIPVEFLKDYYT